jgi:hypothetical protein
VVAIGLGLVKVRHCALSSRIAPKDRSSAKSNGVNVLGTATERVQYYSTYEGLDTNLANDFCSDYFM